MCGDRGRTPGIQPRRSTAAAAGSHGAGSKHCAAAAGVGATSLRRLQEQLVQHHIEARDLEAVSRSLQLREQLLWTAVDSSSAYAAAILQQLQQAQGPATSSSSSWCSTAMMQLQAGSGHSGSSLVLTAAMPHDPAEQLLQQLAQTSMAASSSGSRKLQACCTYTSQLLSRVVSRGAAGRVAAVQAEPLQQLCATLTSLSMQLSLMQQTKSPLLGGDTLNTKVDAYFELLHLLGVAADDKLLVLSTLNLDTVQPEEPPQAHWQHVAQQLQPALRPEQVEQLGACLQAYSAGCARHLQDMAATKQQLGHLLSPDQKSAGQEHGGSASSSYHEAWGGLTLAAAEHMELLLQRIERSNRLLRGQLRLMEQQWCNILDKQQLAAAVVGCYPFLVQPVALCKALAAISQQQEQPQQQQQPQRGAAAGRAR